MKTAFFGLGNMGLPIALNLLKNGHEVRSFIHRSTEGPEALKAAGGIISYTAVEAVKDADIIFTIVPDDDALMKLMLDEKMTASVKDGSMIIEMTSCSPEAVIKLADEYRKRNVEVLDAPVSGGVKAAKNASMTMMCAGDKEVFDRAKPILSQIGKKLFYVGGLGNGKMVKSLNNLLAAINAIGICEVANTVKKQGIDPRIVFNYSQIAGMSDMVRTGGYTGILSVANGEEAIGCDGLILRPLWVPLTFDMGFILREGDYLPKIGRELIQFILKTIKSDLSEIV